MVVLVSGPYYEPVQSCGVAEFNEERLGLCPGSYFQHQRAKSILGSVSLPGGLEACHGGRPLAIPMRSGGYCGI